MGIFRRNKDKIPDRRQSRRDLDSESEVFRRGRTLTGSASSQVRTASEGRADLKSARVFGHELTKKRRQAGAALVAVLLAASLLVGLISQYTAQPNTVASPDASIDLGSVYSDSINSYLGDHPSERLRPLTDVGRLESYLQTLHPEIGSIRQLGSAGFGGSLYELTFREPIASWSVAGNRLYVDGSGTPFGRNYYAPPKLRITDNSGMTAQSGQSVMSNRFMSFIGQVIALSDSHDYAVTDIVIPEDSTRQIEVELEGVAYPFKFSYDRPAGEGVEDMIRAIEWMSDKGVRPDYVDVRVGGRAFYRE